MSIIGFFRRKKAEQMKKSIDERAESTRRKIETSDRIIKMVEDLQIERRCGIQEYHGPERRAHA